MKICLEKLTNFWMHVFIWQDGDGSISIDDLKFMFEKFEDTISHENLQDMFTHADLDKDGVLNFNDFATLMNSENKMWFISALDFYLLYKRLYFYFIVIKTKYQNINTYLGPFYELFHHICLVISECHFIKAIHDSYLGTV